MSVIREIEFENNSPKVAYSGQLLKGRANIYFPVETRIQALFISFSGLGFCQWSNGIDEGQITGSQTYLDKRLDLLWDNSNAYFIAPAGNNHYPFEIQLSHRLPTSYEGTHGYIRYTATLHIGQKSSAKVAPLEEIFTILKPLNLSNSSVYRVPMEVRTFTKESKCCFFLFCWQKLSLGIFGRLPVSGYSPGQTMNLKLGVVNSSLEDILYFVVNFIQEVTYVANNGQKKVERILLNSKQTEASSEFRIRLQTVTVNILVPSLPPTNFSADICGCRYVLNVTARTTFCNHDATFDIPVVIGTYPVSDELNAPLNNERSHVAQPTRSEEPTAPLMEEQPPYPDADPPTYEEAIRSDVMSTENSSFLPKYPTYRRQTSYASECID